RRRYGWSLGDHLTTRQQRDRRQGKESAPVRCALQHRLPLPARMLHEARMAHQLPAGLYIVATPIGNLGDITLRAAEVLGGVAAVACEDTRVTGKLLNHLGLKKRMIRYDDHAGEAERNRLLALMAEQPVALVSDAGTPLISDPGYRLV